ncbi:MAG: hypothetical protein BWY25_02602 [Chloroflexi bacterium ADurb.Bin222]|nr:MAG: hypothetical protein BWY25_02602 [Chloroflexi bacterium ADurb.Bin222]
MGRPKLHVDEAAKHRAYRARLAVETVRVDRCRWEALEAGVSRLGNAFGQAWVAGCETAREIRAPAEHKVLDSLAALDLLAAWFEEQAALARARRPQATDVAAGAGRRRGRRKEGSATGQ